MFNLIDFLLGAGKKVQQQAGKTPILPFLPQVTPNSMAGFQAPLEKQTQEMNPILRSALGPITQVPSFIGENVRQIGRFAGLQPNTMDIATSPLMFMGGVKPLKKLGVDQIDDAIDTVRGGLGNPEDQILALRDIENFAKQNLNPKELKTAGKSTNDLIESIIGKFTDPVDVTKGRLGDVKKTGEVDPLSRFIAEPKSPEITPYNGTEKLVKKYGNIEKLQGENGSFRFIFRDVDGNILGGLQGVSGKGKNIVSNIYVKPEVRRQNIATQLLGNAKKDMPNIIVSDDKTELGKLFFNSSGGEIGGVSKKR